MANTALIKRSSVANKAPTTSDLSLGELAVNTYDGKLFLKKSVGGTESIVDLTNADKLDGQDGSYYTGYTDTAIANLIDSAPNALNTLNELSAALNDDASFSTTVTNSIATKMPLAGGQFTGDVTFNSGANAILLAANSDIRFANGSNWTGDVTGKIQLYNNVLYISGGTGGIIFRESGTNRWRIDGDGHFVPNNGDGLLDIGTNSVRVRNGYFDNLYGNGSNLTNIPAAQLTGVLPALDGSNLTGVVATGTDAATLDSLDSTQFLRSDANDTASGQLTLTSSTQYPLVINSTQNGKIALQGSSYPFIRFHEGTTNKAYIQWNPSGYLQLTNEEDQSGIRIKDDIRFTQDNFSSSHKIWHGVNDGAGSGLDADTLDGVQGSSYLRSDANDTTTGNLILGSSTDEKLALQGSSSPYIRFKEGTTNKAYIQWSTNGSLYIVNDETSEHLRIASGSTGLIFNDGSDKTVWTSGNDGSGSGLDSDTVDGLQASSFLRSDTTQTFTGNEFTFSSSAGQKIILQGATDPYIRFKEGTTNKAYIQWSHNGYLQIINQEDGSGIRIKDNISFTQDTFSNEYKIWNESNDGSGSGLDADTLDGVQGSKFLTSYSSSYTTGWEDSNRNFRVTTGGNAAGLAFHESDGTFAFQVYGDGSKYGFLDGNWASWDIQKTINGAFKVDEGNGLYRVWNAGNDGSGSGLDADTLDGYTSGQFLRSDTNHTTTGNLTISKSSPTLTLNDTNTTSTEHPTINFDTNNNQGVALVHNEFDSDLPVAGFGLILQKSASNTQTGTTLSFNVLGEIYAGATSLGSLSRVLTTADEGSGNGLDADTVDGIQASSFIRSDANDTTTDMLTFTLASGNANPAWSIENGKASVWSTGTGNTNPTVSHDARSDGGTGARLHKWNSPNKTGGSYQPYQEAWYDGSSYHYLKVHNNAFKYDDSTVWTANNDGSGSGLDADVLDGIQASSFLRLDADNNVTSYQNKTTWPSSTSIGTGSGHQASLEVYQTTSDADAFMAFHVGGDYAAYFGLDGGTNDFAVGGWSMGAVSNKVYHAGNDGSGSGLDADTLDGRDLSNSYTSTNSVVMRDSNGNMNAHYATLRKDVSGGVGAYLSIQNRSGTTNSKCGIVFGIGNSNAVLDGGDYGEAQIKCFNDSNGYGNLEINLHTGANRPVMKMVGNGASHNGAGAGAEGMRGGVAFGNAGIAIDRSWMGQPGIHVFNANVENDTDQGTFRFHGWNRSYGSYPASSGSDFGVTLVADGMTLTSDRRRKTGISTITDALATVLQMRGVSYTYVNEELQPQTHMSMDNGKKLGFIAQEVIPLLPQLIHDSGEKAVERENGYCDRYNMDYGGVAPLLVEAIKELVQRIVALESK